MPKKERTNEEWVAELRPPPRDRALTDLRVLLVRGLGAALRSRRDVSREAVEDFAQEALVKVLGNLGSFRGESRFTTWAQRIAVRAAAAAAPTPNGRKIINLRSRCQAP
ncbi:MAG: hypothetical protein M3Q49_12885 [Actinomycetota bacterium]|nr:hypothetical protein [Actinomycetota bacterium]